MATWQPTVPLFPTSSDTKSSTLNQPLQALIQRTDYLKAVLDAVTAGQQLTIPCTNLGATTVVGDAVYLDPDDETYKPAVAKWKDEYGPDGNLVPADSAIVIGFVLSKTSATSGVIVSQGLVDDAAFTLAVLGASPTPGLYLLSASTAGAVASAVVGLNVPCLFYLGGDRCLVLDRSTWLAHSHTHRVFTMSAGWAPVADAQFDLMTKPSGATYGYKIASDANLTELFTVIPGMIKVTGSNVAVPGGTILTTTQIVVNSDNVWWVEAATDPAVVYDEYILYASIPVSYGEPIIRGAKSDYPDELDVSAEQGMLTVNPVPWTGGATGPSGTAIKSVSGKTYNTTPVISSLADAGGLTISVNLLTGAATIGRDDTFEALIDADIVNLDNAVQSLDSPFVYFTMPANRAAEIVGRVPVPKFSASLVAAAFAEVRGINGATLLVPITFPSITVTMTFVPSPEVTPVALGSLVPLVTSFSSFSSVQDTLYYLETPDPAGRIAVSSEGMLYVRLSIAAGSYDKDIFRFGAILYAAP